MQPAAATTAREAHAAVAPRAWPSALSFVALTLLAVVVADLFAPHHHDLRRFDPSGVARSETRLWRAYYDKRPWAMQRELASQLRAQHGFPWLRSHLAAFHAMQAAFLFKQGRGPAEYDRALAPLARYYAQLGRLGRLKADPQLVARLELDWWVARRQTGADGPARIAALIARTAAALYGVPETAVQEYARWRESAMRFRDETAYSTGMLEPHWETVQDRLTEAYRALSVALDPGPLAQHGE